ncbi:MAG TPA: thioredoxin domain-containing protein, partial [Candidatus Sulfomarinibacteraceae bacterium]|nr:thioredoxin domain-containing protein [Candidatus Sulfomarinibacteraceae bacterium]
MSHPSHSMKKNRLAKEKSPYLLQHAGNPVEWYPWGEEAFERARAEDRPIFLSIGYATCHWCHVMEHESFEDPIVAALMNEAFVNVKVDREERPDVDQVYMTVCQILTGSGGWPLTIIMTPDKVPFFAGTYLPRETRFGRMGMVDLVPRGQQLWSSDRERALTSAGQIRDRLAAVAAPRGGGEVDQRLPNRAFAELEHRYDPVHGGFGTAPKFPAPHNLIFLARHSRLAGRPRALEMVERTLGAMRRGGIFDQVGFGFHRYSTDARWLLPHFEKMLYDQATMVLASVEAFVAGGGPLHRRTAAEVAAYVLRDMTSPDGAVSSEEDADSEGEEGLFYVWTDDELIEVLGHDDGAFAA